jgi:7-cyano-7-deazaguanine reductase
MSEIEQIASVHLGKAGDGSVVKPYITPEQVDASLLVPIPRKLNRTQYNIDENNLPFCGYDTWNCYEVSFLLDNGFPVSCVAKIVYMARSEFIVESKSLKLYLNSFNMHRFGDTINQAIKSATNRITQDLENILETVVSVHLFAFDDEPRRPLTGAFMPLEQMIKVNELEFDRYNESPDILVPSNSNTPVWYHSNSLRSNCRVTNQPDWGDVYIYMYGKVVPTSQSLLQYIVSMRKENHFHEEICECIYKRLYDMFTPKDLFVACLYTRRGGIDINPVRASSPHLLTEISKNLMIPSVLVQKTMRQ